MRKGIPSIRGIEAFVIAAEQGGMRAAAATMNLTPSAVSHRIQLLENELGTRLFERTGQRLALTPAGARYRHRLIPLLKAMEEASNDIRPSSDHKKIVVASIPAFYSNWLSSRIHGFLDRYPDVEIDLLSNETPGLGADVTIRPLFGQRAYIGERRLFGWSVTPICHPDLVRRYELRKPADLRRAPLADLSQPLESWPLWFAAAGLPVDLGARWLVLDSTGLMYDMALQGAAVAIGTSFFADHFIDRGLVCPFDVTCDIPGGMYLSPAPAEESPFVKAFRDWLIDEVAKTLIKIRERRAI